MTLNVYSLIGIVLLLGLVTKNSILLVEFANQRMAAGAGRDRGHARGRTDPAAPDSDDRLVNHHRHPAGGHLDWARRPGRDVRSAWPWWPA